MQKYLMMLALVMLPTFAMAESSPHAVVESYFSHLEKGDAEGASKLVSPKLAGSLRPENQVKLFEKKMRPIKDHGGIEKISITDQKATDSVVVMSVAIAYKDKSTAQKRMSAKKIDGAWKLSDL